MGSPEGSNMQCLESGAWNQMALVHSHVLPLCYLGGTSLCLNFFICKMETLVAHAL